MATVLAALAIGIPAALVALWPLLRRREEQPAGHAPDDARAALEAEKVLALRALRELEREREAGLLSEADHVQIQARYEARASAILGELDRLGPARPAAAPAPRPPAAPRPAARIPWTQRPAILTAGALVVLAFGVALGMLVMRESRPAPPERVVSPGGVPEAGVTGLGGSPAEAGSARPIPEGMLAGMLQAAHASLDEGRYQEAIAAYKAVLRRHPDNVDAITHLGVILALAGHTDEALEAFDRALTIDPSYPHALWDKARVLYELRQDYAGAIAAWERFVAVAPEGQDRERARARIREATRRLTESPVAPAAPSSSKP